MSSSRGSVLTSLLTRLSQSLWAIIPKNINIDQLYCKCRRPDALAQPSYLLLIPGLVHQKLTYHFSEKEPGVYGYKEAFNISFYNFLYIFEPVICLNDELTLSKGLEDKNVILI